MQRSVSSARAEERRPLVAGLLATRHRSERLGAPLTPEDMTAQPPVDGSPAKWHLAHVTWFFETFVLVPFLDGYRVFDPAFNYCFNSYYESQGRRHPRRLRGVLTRPSSNEVWAYRAHVDVALERLLASPRGSAPDVGAVVEIGIHHEQQHQELMLADVLALFAASPLRPAYQDAGAPGRHGIEPIRWLDHPGGIHAIGHYGAGFSYDNERPRHDVLVRPFQIADRLVTNGEWLAFMDDGGYRDAAHWLADGWAIVNHEGWEAPLYWEKDDGGTWRAMTLQGRQDINPAAPVTHISYFEADAYARWCGARLPTEAEWEIAASSAPPASAIERTVQRAEPVDVPFTGTPRQLYGEVWQWTQSAYAPYPGYRPAAGALGEYNGKFMVSQQVLRGSSVATAPGHARATYRNFFYPRQRWQFTGLRLAREAV